MKKIKLISLGLILASALVFSGCSGNKDSTNTNTQTGNEQQGNNETNSDSTEDSEQGDSTDETPVKPEKPAYTIKYANAKAEYGTELQIKTKNITEEAACYTKANGVITFKSATPIDEESDIEVTLSGYFKGQIVNEVKGLVINLKGVYLENNDDSVIAANAKTEISAKKDTVNYIVSELTKTETEKTGAITSAKNKNIELGGAGTCYIIGNVYHGLKSDKVEFKGNGTYNIQGTNKGSSINCNNFIIKKADAEDPKSITMNFYNAKNGIKADKSINIQNGTLNFYGHETALKTDKAEAGQEKNTITLTTCKINTKDVDVLTETDNCVKDTSAVIKEE